MGITGLLPFLKNIQRDVHVSSFRGRKAGVDAYCWLHKGAYSCAMQLVMKTENLEGLPFIRYCMKRVNLLRQYDITPVMVFDGGYLPTKSRVEKERREKRDTYLQRGKALLKEGKKSEAFDCFQKCVDVSPEMALAFIKECRSAGVECIVAPYEADAQLAYLQKEGLVDLVITEDSDMLVFGCKRVLFKMDESGNGKLIELQDLGKANKSLIGFTPDSFRQMCILSGCDYLSSVPGVGLGKASKLMRKFNHNPYKVIKSLQYETGKVPKDYETNFRKAEYTFLYQLVFNPCTQKQVRLNDLPDDVSPSDFEFAGVESSPRKAIHMARGNINPITYEVMDTFSPSKAPPPKSSSSSWHTPVMGGPGRPLPLAGTQTRLRLYSSENSKKQFRPPKRKLPAPTEDASLKDEDLQSMYLTSTISEEPWHLDTATPSSPAGPGKDVSLGGRFRLTSSPHRKPKVVSRFFAMKTPEECTPSEVEPSQQGVAVSKLELLADETDGPCLSGPNAMNVNSSTSAEDSETTSPEHTILLESIDCVPHPYQPPPSHKLPDTQSPAKKRLLFPMTLEDKFSFSRTKRCKLEECVTCESSPGEDATALTTSTKSIAPEEHSESSALLLDTLQQSSESMPSLSQTENCSELFEENSECSHAQLIQTNSYVSSEDFIMTAASLEETSSALISADLPDSQSGSSWDSREGESSQTVNMVDLTEDITENSTSKFKQPSMLSSLVVSRSSEKRKSRIKVGLQKPGSRSSFKAPRPSSPAMKQSSLASFMYTRRPQMK